MGLGGILGKIGSGISNAAKKAWTGAKNVGGKIWDGVKYVGKAAKPVVNIAQKITGLTGKIPGMIGEASKWVKGGLDKVNDWIGMIPDGKIKDKLREASDDVSGLVNRGEEYAQDIGGKIAGGINQTKPWVNYAGKVIDGLEYHKDGVSNPFISYKEPTGPRIVSNKPQGLSNRTGQYYKEGPTQAEMRNVLNKQAGGMNKNFNVTPSGSNQAQQLLNGNSLGARAIRFGNNIKNLF